MKGDLLSFLACSSLAGTALSAASVAMEYSVKILLNSAVNAYMFELGKNFKSSLQYNTNTDNNTPCLQQPWIEVGLQNCTGVCVAMG